ncbi:MAG: M1 family metallopeptidase [Flavobacteriales bacterium]|nr:M1 family metallopeptidase [Flavobacteriia bacterium]NCP07053.1 M1 family metallopeptidase [Flavobacteriales bacterium]PIV93563.1 MAG: aminopeptidase [Flavobacteriaceae bacterium CG17_big_fil_post_rev_8_21_14_2_50_33_15]PIY10159.1 MAG: aminopeptidase [Flavobacteriaceae bacterium CG_4_10_14_3_um_filter_33_47]PJB19433.1 MAG: aminopeptidase [Flavobacteriaceae bacterium CG_4_9_14_3_um_filter_33_16]
MKLITSLCLIIFLALNIQSQNQPWQGKFEPIDNMIDAPNSYRSASGAPGKAYWQQRADYKINVSLNETNNTISGEETITYYNNSPDDLSYLWIQLDQNVNKKGSEDFGSLNSMADGMNTKQMQSLTRVIDFPAGYSIKYIKDVNGVAIKSLVNNTMMKVLLNEPLKAGTSMSFSIGWSYPITDRNMFMLSREGYEYFPEDDNTVYLIALWFPRMAVYNDTEGWQNQQFNRLGEFALEFGNYEVNITVPEDHIVASTGELQNPSDVLTKTQIQRMDLARTSFNKPVLIVTQDEAIANEKTKSNQLKTWKFKATNVRDFAFASSRKFIWDAQAVKLADHTTMAMSFYPKEGLPVWQEESTQAVVNALQVYSEATFDYPYPAAISVNTSNIGMEFPMISFNGGRPKNGKISDRAKAGMIGTIVHEVGHNWFPMIISSDERKWMWMDEGLNTFIHQRTIAERYPDFNSTTPKTIVPFMSGDKSIMRPIMTTSDNELLSQFGNNFYMKPTVGLQMLRNSIVGKELFDQAFKEYCNRWKYKHPNPADLFRTLEDATATDLDWFFRGWFFTTDHVDMELSNVKWFKVYEESLNIEDQNKTVKMKIEGENSGGKAKDFSSGPEVITMNSTPDQAYGGFLSRLDESEIRKKIQGKNIYEVTIKNIGGLVMPVTIEWLFKDGSTEIDILPAEIWRLNEYEIKRTFVKDKEVSQVNLDPNFEFADVDMNNNNFPKKEEATDFEKFKNKD